jgi:peptidoglycan/xylan/chitin deacetylase (PgdA/CDA1 family)
MNALYTKSQEHDSYAGKLILSILVLFALMIAIMYKIQNGEPLPKNNGFVVPAPTHETIYILSSKDSAELYAKNGLSSEEYAAKLKRFAKHLKKIGYKTKIISSSKIGKLPQHAVLLAVDAPALSQTAKDRIKRFLSNGGNLFFNFTTGYSDSKGHYIGDKFVHEITGLNLSKRLGFVSFKGDGALFMTPKMLSPLATYLNDGTSLTIVLYDKIPFYDTPSKLTPDLFATVFSQAAPTVAKNREQSMRPDESGMGWHGYYGKGKWVYTSFPAYSLYDSGEQTNAFKKLTAGIIDFLANPITTKIYPFIDQESAIFISEDTEYKFTNFQRFADLAQEYKTPVTAFIVAGLAQLPEHKEMMQNIAKNPYVEFASHSTSHKQIVGKDAEYVKNETLGSKLIIDKYAPVPIRGFRPPREELNDLMKKYLSDGGFVYILGATKEFLYPKFDKKFPNLLYIPRHGTDDYSYLVNLDWSQQEIVDQMIKEAHFVTGMNGIYTLSVHTHLFTYGTNINIMRKFFHYLQNHPELKPLSGRQIYMRVALAQNLHQSTNIVGNQLVITLTNDNAMAVKDLNIKLFKHPGSRIIKGGVDNPKVVASVDNLKSTIHLDTVPAKSTIKIYLTLDHIEG